MKRVALIFTDGSSSFNGSSVGGTGHLIRSGDTLHCGGARTAATDSTHTECVAALDGFSRFAALSDRADSALLMTDCSSVALLVNGAKTPGHRSAAAIAEINAIRARTGIGLSALWVKGHTRDPNAVAFANACCDLFANHARRHGDFDFSLPYDAAWRRRLLDRFPSLSQAGATLSTAQTAAFCGIDLHAVTRLARRDPATGSVTLLSAQFLRDKMSRSIGRPPGASIDPRDDDLLAPLRARSLLYANEDPDAFLCAHAAHGPGGCGFGWTVLNPATGEANSLSAPFGGQATNPIEAALAATLVALRATHARVGASRLIVSCPLPAYLILAGITPPQTRKESSTAAKVLDFLALNGIRARFEHRPGGFDSKPLNDAVTLARQMARRGLAGIFEARTERLGDGLASHVSPGSGDNSNVTSNEFWPSCEPETILAL